MYIYICIHEVCIICCFSVCSLYIGHCKFFGYFTPRDYQIYIYNYIEYQVTLIAIQICLRNIK